MLKRMLSAVPTFLVGILSSTLVLAGPNTAASHVLQRSKGASPIISQLVLPSPVGGDLVTDGDHQLAWVTKHSVVIYNLRTRHQQLVATSEATRGGVGPIVLSNSWVVYVDDPEWYWTGDRWILKARNLDTGKTRVIARADPTVKHAGNLIPSIAMSGDNVAWTFWHGQPGHLTTLIGLYNLRTQYTHILARAFSPNALEDVTLSGHRVAWSKTHTVPQGNSLPIVTSTLWLDDLYTNKLDQIEATEGASELSMCGHYLVYKGAARAYGSGDIYLYDTQAGRTTRLTRHGAAHEVDGPSVGASVVAWNEQSGVGPGIYDLKTHRRMHLNPPGGGRALTAGHVLIYIAAKDVRHPEQGFELIVDQLR